jgi:hypothetical protein
MSDALNRIQQGSKSKTLCEYEREFSNIVFQRIQQRWFHRQWCPRNGDDLGVRQSESGPCLLASDRLVPTGRRWMKVG